MPFFEDRHRLRFVNDGQKVSAPSYNGKGGIVRCVVTKACGTSAYVEAIDPEDNYARWIEVTELFPEVPNDYKKGDEYREPGTEPK